MKSKHVLIIIFWIFIVFGMFSLISGATFSLSSTRVDTELTLLEDYTNKNGVNRYYWHLNFKDEDINTPINIFRQTYGENFKDSVTKILSVGTETGLARFECYFNDIDINFQTALVSGNTYSQQQDLLRFETVCINIYKYRPRTEETYFNPNLYDGFIYIPDYFANQIIEISDGIESYDDLLFGDNIFSISNGEQKYKYKIANIFHVDGFDLPSYSYNDFDTGKKLSEYIGDYCFVSNYSSVIKTNINCYPSLTYMSSAKKFILQEELNNVENISSDDVNRPLLFFSTYNKNSEMSEYSRFIEIQNAFFGPEHGINIWFFLPFMVLVLMLIISNVLIFYKSRSLFLLTHKIFFVSTLIILLIYQLSRFLFNLNEFVLLALNNSASLFLIFLFVVSLVVNLYFYINGGEDA